MLPAFVSPSVTIPVINGHPALGTWQSVVLVDTNVDNHSRRVRLSFIAGLTGSHPEDPEAIGAPHRPGVDGGEGDPEHGPGVTGVDEPVVADPRGRVVGLLLVLDLGLDLEATSRHPLPRRRPPPATRQPAGR